jgi:hypothetical protein
VKIILTSFVIALRVKVNRTDEKRIRIKTAILGAENSLSKLTRHNINTLNESSSGVGQIDRAFLSRLPPN